VFRCARSYLVSVSATEKRMGCEAHLDIHFVELIRLISLFENQCTTYFSPVSASLPVGEFGALQKVRLAVAMPLILVGIVVAYSVLKFLSVHCSSTANHVVKTHLSRFLVHKAVTVLSSLFTALSIFYMRAILRPFN
jgi:hypothetical protein